MQRQELEKLGWTTRGLSYLEKRLQSCEDEARRQDCYRSVFVFASPLFQEMWQRELQGLTEGRAQALLRGVMHLCLMPRDLSGTCEETAFLLKRFWPACPPHSSFWSSFSRVVQVAFAQDPLANKAGDQLLKRQVHQFRYLLSAYQAQWIREHYARAGQTDEEALQAYLQETKGIKIDAYAAARLHNKVYVDQDGQLAFPSRAQAQLNFKVLLNFHTEYILDQGGQFLNEVDPYQISENGIVNGYIDGSFRPNDAVSMQEMLTIFYRYAQKKSMKTDGYTNLNSYRDGSRVGSYAQTAFQWALANKLMIPLSTYLYPTEDADRGEAAIALKALNQL